MVTAEPTEVPLGHVCPSPRPGLSQPPLSCWAPPPRPLLSPSFAPSRPPFALLAPRQGTQPSPLLPDGSRGGWGLGRPRHSGLDLISGGGEDASSPATGGGRAQTAAPLWTCQGARWPLPRGALNRPEVGVCVPPRWMSRTGARPARASHRGPAQVDAAGRAGETPSQPPPVLWDWGRPRAKQACAHLLPGRSPPARPPFPQQPGNWAGGQSRLLGILGAGAAGTAPGLGRELARGRGALQRWGGPGFPPPWPGIC